MWSLTPNDLKQLHGAGGERFAHFVDRLICSQAAKCGIPDSEIATQLRVNIPDGGVDTQVKCRFPDDASGWFGHPTCWQFKAANATDVNDRVYKKKKNDLQKEIHKSHVRKLIEKGYAYRFCLLGDMPAEKTEAWELQLVNEVRCINPQAPRPLVVHGGHLTRWCQRFPGVIAWLRGSSESVLHFEAWRSNCRAVTRKYVPNRQWDGISEIIRHHIDFRSLPIDGLPCLTIGGAAGVGKTRLVFETLAESDVSSALIVYAADEQVVKKVAITIAGEVDQSAILVADECTSRTQLELNEYLKGHASRLRVICIDNTAKQFATGTSQNWLSADSLTETDAILEANYPDVPPDRRHQYVQLSRGFVRLAADMCQFDDQLKSGDMSALLGSVEQYVRDRLSRLKVDYLPLISLLALFHKVGFRDDVKSELEALCSISNRSAHDFREAVGVVRDSPGFVVQAGRYWYVTPEIVARTLFAEGWKRWVVDDAKAFVEALPEHFQGQFVERASQLGSQEVRDQLASFFRQWFHQLTADDLVNSKPTSLAAAIVETNPEQYLPILRDVIENAPNAILQQISGRAEDAKWGPRRTLVWLLENLVSFPEFFSDCEACLFHLALNESEPQIGNNATKTWQQLFHVRLSGTATPFTERIKILTTRTASEEPNEARLAFQGVARAVGPVQPHVIGPPVAAGRLRPRDWQPQSAQEEIDCYRQTLELCKEHLHGQSPLQRTLAFDVLVDSASFFLHGNLFHDFSQVFSPDALNHEEKRRLVNAVDRFLEWNRERSERIENGRAREHTQRVAEWIDEFRPTDFGERLKSICAREPWDRRFSTNLGQQRDEMDDLADQIVANPERLRPHLQWLSSREAQSAERLGFALGRIDEDHRCFEMIFDEAIERHSPSVLRGYVRGLVFADRHPSELMFERLQELENENPQMAVDILSFGGDHFDAFKKILQLVESKAVSPRFLSGLAMGVGRRELELDEAEQILPFFVCAAQDQVAESAKAGVSFLSTFMRYGRNCDREILDGEEFRNGAWELVDATLPFVHGMHSNEWMEIVHRLATYDTHRAAHLFGRALLSEHRTVTEQAARELSKLASESPDNVMAALGEALLDDANGWRLQVDVLDDVVERLPVDVVLQWVRHGGLQAARAVARHLPSPRLDDAESPIVPELLDTILREFNDQEVFESFLAGTRSTEVWWGNASDRFRREAEVAKKFLGHPNKWIREWAKREIANLEHMAEWEEQSHAERHLPS